MKLKNICIFDKVHRSGLSAKIIDPHVRGRGLLNGLIPVPCSLSSCMAS